MLGLMGDNGAGKSTLVQDHRRQFSAHHRRDPAERRAGALPQVRWRRARKGIEIVYQDLALCNNLTAAANVFLGREVKRGSGPFRLLDHGAMYSAPAHCSPS